jgi:hypothetical protein
MNARGYNLQYLPHSFVALGFDRQSQLPAFYA